MLHLLVLYDTLKENSLGLCQTKSCFLGDEQGMKKMVIPLLLSAAFLLSACSAGGEEEMTIEPSTFSEETEQVLEIIDDELVFFDYEVSDLIRSVSVDLWNYENGEWVSVGKCYGNLDTREGQLAVRLMDTSWDVFFIEDGSHSKSSYKRTSDWSDAVATSGYRLSTTHEIQPGRAITLWAELGYSETNAQVAVTDDFRAADCDYGTAATVTFSSDVVD